MRYNEWIAKVDSIVRNEYILGIDDRPDFLWRDLYEDGLDPEEAFDVWEESWIST